MDVAQTCCLGLRLVRIGLEESRGPKPQVRATTDPIEILI
jgi:hypothetical protein